ncbi:hypothetical protein Celaphus_00013475 [Cervus elaphus hippelaphus]|uniref:Uncharacterized protein n=1 Tax=Cervus elaphus hippelaphus TaxID=46360 RepID=A0A212DGW6_CEREH|nr:hypothetical protein Celaphus_00013475 [Cervus elaphus hippelaphus]
MQSEEMPTGGTGPTADSDGRKHAMCSVASAHHGARTTEFNSAFPMAPPAEPSAVPVSQNSDVRKHGGPRDSKDVKDVRVHIVQPVHEASSRHMHKPSTRGQRLHPDFSLWTRGYYTSSPLPLPGASPWDHQSSICIKQANKSAKETSPAEILTRALSKPLLAEVNLTKHTGTVGPPPPSTARDSTQAGVLRSLSRGHFINLNHHKTMSNRGLRRLLTRSPSQAPNHHATSFGQQTALWTLASISESPWPSAPPAYQVLSQGGQVWETAHLWNR